MTPAALRLLVGMLACATLSAAPHTQTFVGVVSDDMCWKAGHARMQMGPTDADCTRACVTEHDAAYVLVAGRNVYTLTGQTSPGQFAARKVKVTGVVDSRTQSIRIASIALAK